MTRRTATARRFRTCASIAALAAGTAHAQGEPLRGGTLIVARPADVDL